MPSRFRYQPQASEIVSEKSAPRNRFGNGATGLLQGNAYLDYKDPPGPCVECAKIIIAQIAQLPGCV